MVRSKDILIFLPDYLQGVEEIEKEIVLLSGKIQEYSIRKLKNKSLLFEGSGNCYGSRSELFLSISPKGTLEMQYEQTGNEKTEAKSLSVVAVKDATGAFSIAKREITLFPMWSLVESLLDTNWKEDSPCWQEAEKSQIFTKYHYQSSGECLKEERTIYPVEYGSFTTKDLKWSPHTPASFITRTYYLSSREKLVIEEGEPREIGKTYYHVLGEREEQIEKEQVPELLDRYEERKYKRDTSFRKVYKK